MPIKKRLARQIAASSFDLKEQMLKHAEQNESSANASTPKKIQRKIILLQ